MRKLTHAELMERQQNARPSRVVPLVVVLDNLRSSHNVGSIFRTCDGAGVEALGLGGITCYPPDARLNKTALGAQDDVVWWHQDDVVAIVEKLKTSGYQIVVVEQTDTSLPYEQFQPSGPVCLVVGNEISGVDEKIVRLADFAIEIEMSGIKNSLNVAVAAGIVIYDVSRKLRQAIPEINQQFL